MRREAGIEALEARHEGLDARVAALEVALRDALLREEKLAARIRALEARPAVAFPAPPVVPTTRALPPILKERPAVFKNPKREDRT